MRKGFFALLFCLFFSMPACSEEVTLSEHLEPLRPLIGEWVVVNSRRTETGWEEIARTEAVFRPILKGEVIEEKGAYTTGPVFGVQDYFTWDKFRGVFRVALMDDTHGLMDIYEGQFNDENELVIDNVRAGTYFKDGNNNDVGFRFRFNFSGEHPYILIDSSGDHGETWMPSFRVDYLPKT